MKLYMENIKVVFMVFHFYNFLFINNFFTFLVVKDDIPEEKKVIYNVSIKKKGEAGIIMMPDISELISEAPT